MRAFRLAAALLAALGLLCGHSGASSSTTVSVNSLVDEILSLANSAISEEDVSEVDLPGFTESFKKKILFVHISGHFTASDGWVKSLATLERTGNATLTASGDDATVSVNIGLSDLQFGYDYKAKLGKIGPTGSLTGTVSSNSILLEASFDLSSSDCTIGIDSVELADLGKVKVKATGLGKLDFLYSKIVSLVTDKLRNKIKKAVNSTIEKYVKKAALSLTCDDILALL